MKTLTAGNKTYNLYWTNGKVAGAGKNMETRVQGGGGGGFSYKGTGSTAPVSITSTTIIHDQIFLVDAGGQEHAFQLQNFNVACREGNTLAVIWAIKEGKNTGPYIIAHNYTTSQSFFNKQELNKVFRYPAWYVLIGIVICLILGKAISFFYLGVFILPIAWLVIGSMEAKKFQEKINFNEFK